MPNNLCYFLPPKEIFDILHEAETKGIKIPEVVDEWWESETIRGEEEREMKEVDKEIKG